ncbi:MAG: hypothetical protein K2N13_08570 [Paraprevotella sp.]|nr:hypothetical protein [Paraprevotella sp.]
MKGTEKTVWTAFVCLCLCMSCKCHKAEIRELPRPDGKRMSVVGSGRDSHGCLSGAGYLWSEMLQDCIRPLEAGICLRDVARPDGSLGAYAVFAPDSSRVEVYMPMSSRPSVLVLEDGSWKGKEYRFCRSAEQHWQLWKGGTLVYSE